MDKFQKAFDSVLQTDTSELKREDVLSMLAFMAMRVFRAEVGNMSQPLGSYGVISNTRLQEFVKDLERNNLQVIRLKGKNIKLVNRKDEKNDRD